MFLSLGEMLFIKCQIIILEEFYIILISQLQYTTLELDLKLELYTLSAKTLSISERYNCEANTKKELKDLGKGLKWWYRGRELSVSIRSVLP